MDDPRDISKQKEKIYYIKVLEKPNNVYCKEHCVFGCHFDAGDIIYVLEPFGYLCYDCFKKLEAKEGKELLINNL